MVSLRLIRIKRDDFTWCLKTIERRNEGETSRNEDFQWPKAVPCECLLFSKEGGGEEEVTDTNWGTEA